MEFGGFPEGFRERRVRVDHVGQIGHGGAGFQREGGFGDQIARARANNGGAQKLAGGGIGQDFSDAIAPFEGQCPSTGRPRELGDFGRNAFFRSLGFGEADPGDLRIGENHGRDVRR